MGIPILNYTFFLWAGKLVDSLITMKLHVIESAKWVMSHLFVISSVTCHMMTPLFHQLGFPQKRTVFFCSGEMDHHMTVTITFRSIENVTKPRRDSHQPKFATLQCL